MSLDLVSLFSGVGGIDLGFHAAGGTTRLLCEYDPHAQKVLARRFPGVPIHPDVTELTADDLYAAGARPERTALLAGFPCQDLSVAGARRGMGQGTRSGLYWHVDRILGEFRPAWVVLENVPGLLSATCPCRGDESCVRAGLAVRCDGELHAVPGGGACVGGCIPVHGGVMGAVLGSLAERGYGFAYRVLDAQFFGVPQRRRRVVIVGRLGDSGAAPAQVLLEPEGRERDSAAGAATWPGVADEAGYGVGVAGEPGGVANTLTARDAKGPLPDQSLGTVILADVRNGTEGDTASTLQGGANGGRGWDLNSAPVVVSTLQAGGGDRGYRIDAEAAGGGHLIPCSMDTFQKVIRPATSDHPDVWEHRDVAATLSPFDLGSDSRAVEVVVQPAVTTLGERTHALTAEGADASEDGTGRGTPIIAATLTAGTARPGVNPPGRRQEDDHNIVATETTVRRLTPLECERLQGFPDNWTDGQSDSHRYRQMGNAVAVPVFAWVARRLMAVHEGTTKAVAE